MYGVVPLPMLPAPMKPSFAPVGRGSILAALAPSIFVLRFPLPRRYLIYAFFFFSSFSFILLLAKKFQLQKKIYKFSFAI
jgi:hypothetical protein